jgi:hypothetical protein
MSYFGSGRSDIPFVMVIISTYSPQLSFTVYDIANNEVRG